MWQIEGLIWGFSVGAWIIAIVNAWLVAKHIKYSMWQQLKDLSSIILLSLITFLLVYSISHTIVCNIYLKGIIALIIYIAVYLGLSLLFKIKVYSFVKETLLSYCRK